MAVSPEVVDWLACCGRERDAPKFVNSGVDSINKLRNLPEDQFRKIGLDSWMFRRLQDRTSTVEELSQEVSVSVVNTMTTNILWSVCGCQSLGWHDIIFNISCN